MARKRSGNLTPGQRRAQVRKTLRWIMLAVAGADQVITERSGLRANWRQRFAEVRTSTQAFLRQHDGLTNTPAFLEAVEQSAVRLESLAQALGTQLGDIAGNYDDDTLEHRQVNGRQESFCLARQRYELAVEQLIHCIDSID